MKKAISVFMFIALIVPVSGAHAGEGVHFESLTTNPAGADPVGGAVVAIAVQIVSAAPGSDYLENLEAGKSWSCMAMVIDAIVARMRQSSETSGGSWMSADNGTTAPLARDSTGENSIFGYHSGKRWRYWQHVAHLGVVAYELDMGVTVDTETSQLLTEMRESFAPLLRPEDAEVFFLKASTPGE